MIYPRATTEFIYRYKSPDIAQVYLSFKLATNSRRKEVSEVLSTLEQRGMQGYDISDDEMAKSHSRYMIGGAQRVENERLFRFGTYHPPFAGVRPGIRPGRSERHSLQSTYHEHRISRKTRSAQEVPVEDANEMEHLAVPLSEPWGRYAHFYLRLPRDAFVSLTTRAVQISARFLLEFKCRQMRVPNSMRP